MTRRELVRIALLTTVMMFILVLFKFIMSGNIDTIMIVVATVYFTLIWIICQTCIDKKLLALTKKMTKFNFQNPVFIGIKKIVYYTLGIYGLISMIIQIIAYIHKH